MILHIPHASLVIPEQFRQLFCLNDTELEGEHLLLCDRYTNELFEHPHSIRIESPYSRLLVDVERFREDDDEPMSKVGVGVIYSHTTQGTPLKHDVTSDTRDKLLALYDAHHKSLEAATSESLLNSRSTIIVDCHSFPDPALPCDINQEENRPDSCIGCDSFHTPQELANNLVEHLEYEGYRVAINKPYAGTIVPLKHYQHDTNVKSIMIEINRKLYMDQTTGMKTGEFESTKTVVSKMLDIIDQYCQERK